MTMTMQNRFSCFVSTAISLLAIASPEGADAFTAQLTSSSARVASSRLSSPQTVLAAQLEPDDGIASSRRSFLTIQAASVLAAATLIANPNPSLAAEGDDELIDVYFGCGCFWHVQHEFVEAERSILGRSDEQITARAGYAGGKAGAKDGKVCYHNAQNVADYGKLGHGEVVGMRIPTSKFEDFAKEYFKLFDKDGFRPDQGGDRGTEYRSLIGIPGGKSSPLVEILIKASQATGDKLDFAVGKGDDKDTPKVSFIMDTADFPFFVGEQYHQFHDGFAFGENYPSSYNSLGAMFGKKGEDFGACPNGSLGLGIGGL